jgi:hypothetical protein
LQLSFFVVFLQREKNIDMTNTKKIRLLNEYVEQGLGEQVVLKIEDRWDFDPELFPRKYGLREQYTIADAINQFKEQKGYIFEGIAIKDLLKNIERNQPVVVVAEFQDTKDKFFAEHPNFYKEQQEKLNKMLGMVNKYKSQFMR